MAAAENPIDAAIAAAKAGNLGEARRLLALGPTVADGNLREALRHAEDGMAAFRAGRYPDARDGIGPLAQILAGSTEPSLAANVAVLLAIADGRAALEEGDPGRALEALEPAVEELRRQGFGTTAEAASIRAMAAQLEVTIHGARLRQAFTTGELDRAEQELGAIRELQDERLETLRREGRLDPTELAAAANDVVEIVAEFARTDLEALDLDAARRRLESARKDAELLGRALPRLEGRAKLVAGANLAFYDALSGLEEFGRTVFAGRSRSAPKRKEVRALERIGDLVFELRERGAQLGGGGSGWIVSGERLAQILQNWATVGTNLSRTRRDNYVSARGLVTYVLWLIALGVFWRIGHPQGYTLYILSVVGLGAALIAGFGFGALRFIPLFKTLTSLRGKDDSAKGKAKAGGAEHG